MQTFRCIFYQIHISENHEQTLQSNASCFQRTLAQRILRIYNIALYRIEVIEIDVHFTKRTKKQRKQRYIYIWKKRIAKIKRDILFGITSRKRNRRVLDFSDTEVFLFLFSIYSPAKLYFPLSPGGGCFFFVFRKHRLESEKKGKHCVSRCTRPNEEQQSNDKSIQKNDIGKKEYVFGVRIDIDSSHHKLHGLSKRRRSCRDNETR